MTVDLLVIHCISLPPGKFGTGYIDQLFTNKLDPKAHPSFVSLADTKVSAHFLIDRAGAITQYVSLHQRAWHAGVSSFEGRINCNDFSIGIELEGTDNQTFTSKQYKMLLCLTKLICLRFPAINQEKIVGHSDIAPGRKKDPGIHFDWQKYRQQLSRH